MNRVEKQNWGQITETFRGLKNEDGKQVFSKGTNQINPYGMIPIHFHNEDNEDYIPITAGIKIVVISQEESEKMTKIRKLLIKSESVKIGETVPCPKGYAHALYNASDKVGLVDFVKYY